MLNRITGKASKLEGEGYIHYDVIIAKDGDGLYLGITDNDEGGTSTNEPIDFLRLLNCIVEVSNSSEGCFRPKDLRHAIPGNNRNDPGFVVAILKDIRFVEEGARKGQYRLRREGG